VPEKVACAACGKEVSADQAAKGNGLCLLCSIKLEEKAPCLECGKPVSAKRAAKRQGLCLRCSLKRNPFFVLQMSLVERVCQSPDGFETLAETEKLYYALTLLQHEVNNGGFHQFFFNSSGSYYDLIENGLATFDEPQTRELLHRAKEIVFAEMPVPVDMEVRRERMRECAPSDLDELDQRFHSMPDTLTPKLKSFARERGLVSAEPASDQQG